MRVPGVAPIATLRAFAPRVVRQSGRATRCRIPSTSSRSLPGVARRATAAPGSSTFGSSDTRTDGCRTSPIWSSPDATIGKPMAMYSKSFVGEPKNGDPSSFATCGETTRSDAPRKRGASAWGTSPVRWTRPSALPPTISRTSGIWRPSPTRRKWTSFCASHVCSAVARPWIARASTSVPCHLPNVPRNVTTIAVGAIPSAARVAAA